MTGLPLEGFTVFEMGSALAGPYGARILADLGARVIKIEPPETGESARSWGQPLHKDAGALFHAVNKEKDSLPVDFNDSAAVSRLKELIAKHADVVMQNLRPDVTKKAGLDAETCRNLNPALIYCNISAFGPDGPLAKDPGYEALLQAFSGIIEMTGDPDGPPSRVALSVNDFGTAMWSAIGIIAALLNREKTGEGSVIDTSIFDTSMGWQTMTVASMLSTGEVPKRSGLRGPLLAPNRGFTCSDGMLLVTAGTDTQFAKLCKVLDCEQLLSDPGFATNNARMANDADLTDQLNTIFITQPRDHWWQLLRAVKVPSAPIQTLDETLNHEHTRASGILQNPPDEAQPLVGLPLRIDGNRPGYRRSAPALGEGTEDLTDA
ncbi:CaiB/BaiF CoA-transferase family protein [Labrenzia sp. PHM005]|uniref:CaiB/BaiF CoA transferase family protein n=1 Tax=Labrenzia sp. PHM005 TaxID=2590016 RepID=UPI00113FCE26|nr:CoA transferase [Labrenzia sp. PHM005]QDG78868.1 CoA transferase [Labrenzia sp. PHM005]